MIQDVEADEVRLQQEFDGPSTGLSYSEPAHTTSLTLRKVLGLM